MTDELVTVDIDGGVADVRLNRPGKYNALSPELGRALARAASQLGDDARVRAIVLSGNGPGFCAGLDMAAFTQMASPDSRDEAKEILRDTAGPENAAQRVAYWWKRMPVPVIASMHGAAYGAGAEMSLGADIRIAAPDLRFCIAEIEWGLIPDLAVSQTLPALVGIDVAKELVFTGRVLSGDEALRLGLVTTLAENPLESALTLARSIAKRSPDAIRAAKYLLESTWTADEATGLRTESMLQRSLIGTSNQVEAVNAKFENRAPQFVDGVWRVEDVPGLAEAAPA